MFYHALTFVWSRGSCFNTRLLGEVFKRLSKDPESANAKKENE